MQHCGLQGLFSDGFPMLMQHYDAWQLLLKRHSPRLDRHIKQQLCGFLGLDVKEYEQMVADRMPTRQMLPSMYTTYWFQSMAIGGDFPAPSAIAPRLMDAILLDCHLGVLFQFGFALVKAHERELLRLQADALADALRRLPTRCHGSIEAVMERAHEYRLSDKVVLGTREVL